MNEKFVKNSKNFKSSKDFFYVFKRRLNSFLSQVYLFVPFLLPSKFDKEKNVGLFIRCVAVFRGASACSGAGAKTGGWRLHT